MEVLNLVRNIAALESFTLCSSASVFKFRAKLSLYNIAWLITMGYLICMNAAKISDIGNRIVM